MNLNTSRRSILQSLVASAIVIGFDVVQRSWVTSANAASIFESIPQLDGTLYTDSETLVSASVDFGNIVHRQPIAVLHPGSIKDIVQIIQFARTYQIKVAARGQGHSTYGQSQVEAGIVINMSTFNKIHFVGTDRAIVDAGVLWSQLLQQTLQQGLTPPVLTDYIELSVGGTLSVGGIGGATHRYGVQVDNVLELKVVTGRGQLETCSQVQNSHLFKSVLAGLGQCGIIVQATVKLIRSATNARVFELYYDDLAIFTRDQRLLINDERFNYVEGQLIAKDTGGWRYLLEAASFYSPPNIPNNNFLLAGLNYTQGTEKIEDKTYFEFLNRLASTVAFLKSIGVWSFPHPWLDLFVPNSAVESFVGKVAASLTLADTGQGPILLYPVKTKRFQLPLFRVPKEKVMFLFSILRTAVPPDSSTVTKMLNDNRRLFEQNRDLGGYLYPISSVPFSRNDWQQHFGWFWRKLVSAKRRYDPDNLLTPSLGIIEASAPNQEPIT
ncbi:MULTISPECIES: FAD-binding protein [unclassified Nostoc]|uniref:FAD-binding protein n=1 Tax=unclassified Nostoc TaxID=2593658 RepID=UPI002AD4FFA0|nr:FAD-binding protein [Nostoc sp. DedQUE03]MDZ7972435.1 FAD-binding protein [Nostoc sp. DedQUE03]MDZ8044017.1 FAD-binding protein [Nostoc sp. DedQUE02]